MSRKREQNPKQWQPSVSWRLDSADPLLDCVNRSDARKALVREALAAVNPTFGTRLTHRGILDAFHGETHFGLDPDAASALANAWRQLLDDTAKLVEPSGLPYDKKSPKILRELSAMHLFGRLHNPSPAVSGVRVSPDDVVVCPYSSTILLEEAFATVAKPGGVILSPEGFYKSNALHLSKYGLKLGTVAAPKSRQFKLDPDALREAVLRTKKDGTLCALLLTMPGNPLVVDYSLGDLQELARLVVEEGLLVICDAAFDKFQPTYVPLAAMTVPFNGRDVSLYDHVLTVSGNSKSHNAIGPCKFGAACTGNVTWRRRLQERMTTAFQRETTHLVRVLFEHTSNAYFDANLQAMHRQQQLARQVIHEINARSGNMTLEPLSVVPHGMFLNVEFSAAFVQASGVRSSLELEDLLLLAQGVNSTCFSRMGSDLLAVRLNILSPRKNGKKDPALLTELMDRIEKILQDVAQGLTYDEVLKDYGLSRDTPATVHTPKLSA